MLSAIICGGNRTCQAYSALKKRLAEEFPYDIESYCNGKNTFVKDVEVKALLEPFMAEINDFCKSGDFM